ncbi:hypothetical protein HY634_03375 [Candidatus Uhrbacteria bacterium]|nr:hypothetical protein [Candidatus Uhrbacteria bacterium]
MRMSFIAVGDSITYGFCDPEGGWVQRLRRLVDVRNASDPDADYRVYNLGIAGETSDDLLVRFSRELSPRVRNGRCIILLGIGINDARYLRDAARCQTPIERYADNVRQLIAQAQTCTPDVVVLGLTRVIERLAASFSWNPNLSCRNADIERYDHVLEAMCSEAKIGYVSLGTIGWTEALLEDDGLHPNGDGHARIFDRVRDALVERTLLK